MTLRLRAIHDTGGRWAKDKDITDLPCPSITCGVNGLNSSHFTFQVREMDGKFVRRSYASCNRP